MDSRSLIRTAAAWVEYRSAPIALTFELTHLCNLACVYCDRHTPMPQEMSREQIFTALGGFFEMGTWKVNLDGGEPLAHKHVDEIVRWLTEASLLG